jgi:hypothetical protein
MAGVSTRPSAEKGRLTVSVRLPARGEVLQQLWGRWEADGRLEQGLLPIAQVDTFLSEAALGSAGSSLESIAGQDSQGLTYEQM